MKQMRRDNDVHQKGILKIVGKIFDRSTEKLENAKYI